MITIKRPDGTEITVDTAEEFGIVMGVSIAPTNVSNETVTEKVIEAEPESMGRVIHNSFHKVNMESRYYRNGNGKRRFKTVGMVFDYIEAHKRGRTTDQIHAHFNREKSTIWGTLNTLKNDGLIYQPGGRGTAWLATAELGNSIGEPNANES